MRLFWRRRCNPLTGKVRDADEPLLAHNPSALFAFSQKRFLPLQRPASPGIFENQKK